MGEKIKSPFVEEKSNDPRFTSEEIKMLQLLDESKLKLVRKIFYNELLTEKETSSLKDVLSEKLLSVFDRLFLLNPEWNAPIFQMSTRWDNPRFDSLIIAECRPLVLGRQKALKFIKAGLERMRGLKNDFVLDLRMEGEYEKMTPEEIKIEAVAVQEARSIIESTLLVIYGYSLEGKKTIQEMIERMRKNSSK